MPRLDVRAMGFRVAGLIHGEFQGDLGLAARELHVSPEQLKRVIEGDDEVPSATILAAIVSRLGVDANWLITGEYDWRAHSGALQSPLTPSEQVGLVRKLLSTG